MIQKSFSRPKNFFFLGDLINISATKEALEPCFPTEFREPLHANIPDHYIMSGAELNFSGEFAEELDGLNQGKRSSEQKAMILEGLRLYWWLSGCL